MKVLPTLEGGLRIDVEGAVEWKMLEQIASDALDDEEALPNRLSALMDEASEWDEMVIPELKDTFFGQVETVVRAIHNAQKERSEEEEGEIFIPQEKGEEWYGALNQARMSLERRYKLNELETHEQLIEANQGKRLAYHRGRLYTLLQGLLLEHVL